MNFMMTFGSSWNSSTRHLNLFLLRALTSLFLSLAPSTVKEMVGAACGFSGSSELTLELELEALDLFLLSEGVSLEFLELEEDEDELLLLDIFTKI